MSRYLNARLRVVRRLGLLPGLTRKITTRNRYPGEHDKKPGSNSDYGIRLEEKQKLRFNYGITESQLYNYVKDARRQSGSSGVLLLQMVEMRLDNVLFRLGVGPTIPACRQLISHAHIEVNGNKVNIPSFQCKKGDTIAVRTKSIDVKTNKNNWNSVPLSTDLVGLPKFLEINSGDCTGRIKFIVGREEVGLKINELLIIEYYSRK